ncbi:MAG: hypothetical protein ABSE61_35760 [Bradyrhizobium sp.]
MRVNTVPSRVTVGRAEPKCWPVIVISVVLATAARIFGDDVVGGAS